MQAPELTGLVEVVRVGPSTRPVLGGEGPDVATVDRVEERRPVPPISKPTGEFELKMIGSFVERSTSRTAAARRSDGRREKWGHQTLATVPGGRASKNSW